MNCKRLNVKLIQRIYETAIKQSVKCATLKVKENEIWLKQTINSTKTIEHQYRVKYCIRYRPVDEPEWILARGWWNDEWIWTPDWIFNDWII